MSVRFQLGGTDFYLQNPDRHNAVEQRRMQVIRQTASGGYFIYDKGVKTEIWVLQWSGLRESEKTDLESFFIDTVKGAYLVFVFTDWRGNRWQVRSLQASIDFNEIADARAGAATTFVSDGVSYPTTTREKGVWATEIRLLVIGSI